jgi:SnoaL-like domain
MTNILHMVANFFTAMQAGSTAADELLSLFEERALYTEPFSGTIREHRGKQAIRAAFAPGWDQPLPSMHIRIDHAAAEGNVILVHWTCRSPALPGGEGKGTNRFVMSESGKIAELETKLIGGGE